jgi:WD40 repeat protein
MELRNPASRFYGVPRDMFDFYFPQRYLVPWPHNVAGSTHLSRATPSVHYLSTPHAMAAEYMCLLPNGNICTAGNLATEMRFGVYSPQDGTELANWSVAFGGRVGGICATSDGLLAVTITAPGRDNTCVRIYSATGDTVRQFTVPCTMITGELRGIALDQDGNLVVCDYQLRRLLVFTTNGKLVHTLACGMSAPMSVAVNPNSGDYYVVCSLSNTVRVFDYRSRELIHVFNPAPRNNNVFYTPTQLCFDKDNNAFVVTADKNDLKAFKADDDDIISECFKHLHTINAIAIDSQGRLYVCPGKFSLSVFTWAKNK